MSGSAGAALGGNAELRCWLRLVYSPGIGPMGVQRLLRAFGTPQQVLERDLGQLRRVIPEPAAAGLLAPPPPDLRELLARAPDWLAEPGRRLLSLADARYPRALLHIPDPPPLLWLRGDPSRLEAQRTLAVVGARNPSAQGARDAHDFAKALAAAGVCVVSGLARGIDAQAHRGALEAGRQDASTVAVLGHGCDRVYPEANRELAQQIAADGLIVSEFALGAPPHAQHFPRRNRIISGLSRGVLVVEAALRSGSLITARLAAEQGREVFAMPGSIHNPMARGCHRLLRDGAQLVEQVGDILQELGWAPAPPTRRDPVSDSGRDSRSGDAVDPRHAAQRELLECMGWGPLGLDELLARSSLPAASVQEHLLELELQGRLARLPGGLLQRIDPA